MNPSTMLANGFGFTQRGIEMNLAGITHQESLHAPEPGGNCLNWIAGHILASRGSILKRLGGQPFLTDAEAAPYRRGAGGLPPEKALPWQRILEGLKTTSATLCPQLEALAPQALDQPLDPSQLPIPIKDPTLGSLLHFLFFHEAYHAGQLGIGRRLLGKESAIK